MKKTVIALVLVLAGCTKERIVYRDAPTGATPVSEATPPPAQPSLRFPQGVPDNDIAVVPGIPTLHDVVNQEIAAMFPACHVYDERCNGQGYSPQSFFNVLNSRLRARGYWSGQHRDGQSDEMVIAKDCKSQWENFHAWYYGEPGYPLWARTVSSPCAGHACNGQSTSYRGNTIIPSSYCK